MVVVRCLILCSKFIRNRLSAGLCRGPLGELTANAPPDPLAESWGKGGKTGGGRAGGGEGKKGAGEKEKRGMNGEVGGREGRDIPLRMIILATAVRKCHGSIERI